MRFEAVKNAWRVTVEKHGLILASAALRNNYSRGLLWRVVYFLVATSEEKSAILFIVFSQLKGGCIVGKNFFRKRKMILPAHNSPETFLSFRNTVQIFRITITNYFYAITIHKMPIKTIILKNTSLMLSLFAFVSKSFIKNMPHISPMSYTV